MIFLNNLCNKILEKQKLRKEMMDLGLICTVVGPTGPTGPAGALISVGTTTTTEAGTDASVVNVGTPSNVILNFSIPTGVAGPQGIQGEKGENGDVGPEGPSFPASVEEMFYTSFVDTKAEGLLTISSPWLIPNSSNYFEVVNENEVLVKPGIYEITLSGLISNADNAHGGHFYLQDENGSEIKALSFSFPQSNGKYAQFYQTTLLRFEEDTKLSVNTIILGGAVASNVEFSNVNLMIKKILYEG